MIQRLRQRLRPTTTLSSVEAYALWAETYPPCAHNPLMVAEGDAIQAMLDGVIIRDQVTLDLASGTGRYGIMLQDMGAQRVIALDNSAQMLSANPLPVRALATFEALPLATESIDIIICGMALGHLPRLGQALQEIARVLTPMGMAFISDFHPILHFSGAKRTFQAQGTTYAVEHYAHLYADYHTEGRRVGLTIEDVREPSIPSHTFAAPVALVLKFQKTAIRLG